MSLRVVKEPKNFMKQIICIALIGLSINGWVKGIQATKKLPKELSLLKEHLMQTFIVAILGGVVLGYFMYDGGTAEYAGIGLVVGGIIGFIATFLFSGLVFWYRINKLTAHYQESSTPNVSDEE